MVMLCVWLLSFAASVCGLPVVKVPGYSGPEVHLDAGYVGVEGAELFYVFSPAEASDAGSRPLVVW